MESFDDKQKKIAEQIAVWKSKADKEKMEGFEKEANIIEADELILDLDNVPGSDEESNEIVDKPLPKRINELKQLELPIKKRRIIKPKTLEKRLVINMVGWDQ